MPVAELEARPRPRVRRGNEAAVERAGAATGTGGGVMKTIEPVEMPLPSHPHVLWRRDIGAPRTSNHDFCASRPKAAVSHRKGFGVRQLAAAFLRRKLASGTPSSKLETQKRSRKAGPHSKALPAPTPEVRYSIRSASMGEIAAARKAGIMVAKKAQRASALAARVSAYGSQLVTP